MLRIDKTRKRALRRKYHVRRKVFGMPDRPRLSVFRSNRHIYAQLIDDVAGVTLASANTMNKDLRRQISQSGNREAAKAVGTAIAKRALKVGIKCVRFDRNRNKYHGRVEALASAAREAGLVF